MRWRCQICNEVHKNSVRITYSRRNDKTLRLAATLSPLSLLSAQFKGAYLAGEKDIYSAKKILNCK